MITGTTSGGAAAKRVFIFSRHPLFGQGVERLLRGEPGLSVVGLEADANKAVEQITALNPDVIILDSSDPHCDPAPIFMHVLHLARRAEIVGLNLSDNVACVCDIEHRLVSDVSDLLDIVRPAVSALSSSAYPGRH